MYSQSVDVDLCRSDIVLDNSQILISMSHILTMFPQMSRLRMSHLRQCFHILFTALILLQMCNYVSLFSRFGSHQCPVFCSFSLNVHLQNYYMFSRFTHVLADLQVSGYSPVAVLSEISTVNQLPCRSHTSPINLRFSRFRFSLQSWQMKKIESSCGPYLTVLLPCLQVPVCGSRASPLTSLKNICVVACKLPMVSQHMR